MLSYIVLVIKLVYIYYRKSDIMNKNKINELSRFISKLLRHEPELANIDINRKGWTNVNDFIRKINNTSIVFSFKSLFDF